MNLLAIIILYRPDKDLLYRNLEKLIPETDAFLLWDNDPGFDSSNMPELPDKVAYLPSQENSISKALNYAWHYAKENGYDYLLTMDQDSVFEDFAAYKKTAEKILEEQDCIIGPWYFPPVPRNDETPVIEREHVITSGMIVPVKLLDEVGGYCEWFRIDGIDIELCVKARQKGYKVFQCINHRLVQQFGNSYEKKVLGHTFSGPGYSPSRLYGIMRNYLITYRKYGRPLFLKQKINWSIANYIPNIIFAEKQKFSKLYNICKGLLDGCRFNIQ